MANPALTPEVLREAIEQKRSHLQKHREDETRMQSAIERIQGHIAVCEEMICVLEKELGKHDG